MLSIFRKPDSLVWCCEPLHVFIPTLGVWEGLVSGSEPLGLILLHLLVIYVSSWKANSKSELRWWQLLTAATLPRLDHQLGISAAGMGEGLCLGVAALMGHPWHCRTPVGGLPWAVWARGCSGQKSGLELRLTSDGKGWVYWALHGSCDVTQTTL